MIIAFSLGTPSSRSALCCSNLNFHFLSWPKWSKVSIRNLADYSTLSETICLYGIKGSSWDATFITVDSQDSIYSSPVISSHCIPHRMYHSVDDPVNVRDRGFDSLPTQVCCNCSSSVFIFRYI